LTPSSVRAAAVDPSQRSSGTEGVSTLVNGGKSVVAAGLACGGSVRMTMVLAVQAGGNTSDTGACSCCSVTKVLRNRFTFNRE